METRDGILILYKFLLYIIMHVSYVVVSCYVYLVKLFTKYVIIIKKLLPIISFVSFYAVIIIEILWSRNFQAVEFQNEQLGQPHFRCSLNNTRFLKCSKHTRKYSMKSPLCPGNLLPHFLCVVPRWNLGQRKKAME